MSETTKFYDMASLAEASYVLFDKLNGNLSNVEAVKSALKDPDFEGRFTAIQAEDFVAHWEVISHQKNTETDFSSTLFRNKDTEEYVYTCRGTEGFFSDDLWSTGYGDIVTDGLAIKQIVDMYNDWQRLNSAKILAYQAAVLEVQEFETKALQSLSGQALQDFLVELRSRPGSGLQTCNVNGKGSRPGSGLQTCNVNGKW